MPVSVMFRIEPFLHEPSLCAFHPPALHLRVSDNCPNLGQNHLFVRVQASDQLLISFIDTFPDILARISDFPYIKQGRRWPNCMPRSGILIVMSVVPFCQVLLHVDIHQLFGQKICRYKPYVLVGNLHRSSSCYSFSLDHLWMR